MAMRAEVDSMAKILRSLAENRENIKVKLNNTKLVTSRSNEGGSSSKMFAALAVDKTARPEIMVSDGSPNGAGDLRATTKIRQQQSKIKALEDNLLTSAASMNTLQNHVKSIRKDANDVTNRFRDMEKKAREEIREKEMKIQVLEAINENLQSGRDDLGNKKNSLTNEAVLEELRESRTENKNLTNQLAAMVTDNSKTLFRLKGLRNVADAQTKELNTARKRISQLETAISIGSEKILNDRMVNLEARVQDLAAQIDLAASNKQGLLNLDAEKANCRRTLLDMAKEASTEICNAQRNAQVQTNNTVDMLLNDGTMCLESGRAKKRARQSEDNNLPPPPAITKTAVEMMKITTEMSSPRACGRCNDPVYGLMKSCQGCSNTFHSDCEPADTASGVLCSACQASEIPK